MAGLETAAGRRVEGAVYRVTRACLQTLDQIEGVDAGHYRPIETSLQMLDAGNVQAATYQAQAEDGGLSLPRPIACRQ